MPKPHERALIELAKEAHEKLTRGIRVGKQLYRLHSREVWDLDLEEMIKFCAEDSKERFPTIAKFSPNKATDLLADIRKRKSQYEVYFLRYVKNYYWGNR